MHGLAQLVRFGVAEALSCLFAAGVFLGLALSTVVPLPIARYDALLVWCLLLTLGFRLVRLETTREMLVILAFHAVGTALELFKVAQGSWVYPEDAVTKVAGVPLYAGFMYAAVGSYICQAWRRLDLRVSRYPTVAASFVAVAIYVNFFTHHWLPDLRVPLAVVGVLVLRRTWVHYRVGGTTYRMPLALSFLLIGAFLWLAENAATFLGAWKYPGQVDVWEVVHASKLGAWALLVTLSFVIVATLKRVEGQLYADRPASAGPAAGPAGASAALVGARPGDDDAGPAAGPVGHVDRPAVGGDEAVDDVHPQP